MAGDGETRLVVAAPFCSAGEVLMRADGAGFEVVPVSWFQLKDGRSVFRVGRTAFFFDMDGRYLGVDVKAHPPALPSDEEFVRFGTELSEALRVCSANIGVAPDEGYFKPDSVYYEAETAVWPKEAANG